MSYNQGAEIVSLSEFNDILRAVAPCAEFPDDYDRIQLLTENAYRNLVFANHDRSYIKYAELSNDFPICSDFAEVCFGQIRAGSIKSGLADRPGFGWFNYTKNEVNEKGQNKRHRINFAVTVQRKVLYYEPQTDDWLDTPKDCKTLDRFRL